MKLKSAKPYEVDMYAPIRDYFVGRGYEVFGEVNHCDLTAIKEDELIIVEFKRNLSVDLLIQAAKRQRYTDHVYVAIPKPKYKMYSKKWQDVVYLIRRLELGLIIVSFPKKGATMELSISPAPFDRGKSQKFNKKKRERIIQEMRGRYGDYNVGGSNQTKIMTAYKQGCIQIAALLQHFGPLSPKALKEKGAQEKTASILSKNFYGWFTRVKRGVYALTASGEKELANYPELVAHYISVAEGAISDIAGEAIPPGHAANTTNSINTLNNTEGAD
ncbi:DUF2161 domain-containing phosphodiesterase [Brevibacillus parabrevis]|uniref:DUF2161 domain-containing phosphodiesterase n=1 Tax=Brevibacillus parabrevis TaxID=54914 RepID=UPI002380B48F|nr:DUF2161 family putative PD-(D/E)XK-type phosphodiesterase [Brevibacillus parabrevis]MED2254574.1 DUF2161 family putative PD-(D/E)XK-type phosphodiesterase [Brevibacillus parabrevis]WDV94173.1 DUF2161 family putative PD-(D/E)XK-type phosphodiesterase [Brevibacillus parabrevis]